MTLLAKFAPLAELRAALAGSGRVPSIATPMDAVHSATEATIDGRRVLLAGTNNYLGLTFDADCRAAAIKAVETLGTGTTGSRMASGNYAGHRALEREFADAFAGRPASCFPPAIRRISAPFRRSPARVISCWSMPMAMPAFMTPAA